MMNKILTIVFSKDRAMQLEACLHSYVIHCKDYFLSDLFVIYKSSNPNFQKAYEILIKEYSNKYNFRFIEEKNFYSQVISLLSLYDYVLFLVDDNIFTRSFHLSDCISLLEQHPITLGFSLRLGTNINYCYPLDKKQKIPRYDFVTEDIIQFKWTEGEYDFGYPLEVSSSIYRTKDILDLLYREKFSNPNKLEDILSKNKEKCFKVKPFLFCFEKTKAFCIPINLTNETHKNRVANNKSYSLEELNKRFLNFERINVYALEDFLPYSCHQEVTLEFIKKISYKTPKVSVVIPSYNQAQYLSEALQSVISQSLQDWECIIVNDGSNDDTEDLFLKIIPNISPEKIIYFEKKNEGLATARNYGIFHSYGEYILPLDADDKIHPDFLMKTVIFLDNHVDYQIAYTDLQEFGIRSNLIRTLDWSSNVIPFQNHLSYCSLYRKEVWHAIGGYNPNMEMGYEDWDFWIGAYERNYKGYRIPEPLFFYRIKQESMYTKAVKHDLKLKAQIILNHPGLYNPEELIWAKAYFNNESWALNIPNQINVIPQKNLLKPIIPKSTLEIDKPPIKKLENFKVLAIISAYNEEDIIEWLIRDFISNGIDVYFIDDNSTDKTLEIVKKYLNKGVINVEIFTPKDLTFQKGKYNWELILKRKEEIASNLDYDWFIHADADEFFESPWLNIHLKEAIFLVDTLNYNAIQFKLFNFRPYNNDYQSNVDVRSVLDHYDPIIEDFNFLQIKAWKKLNTKIDLSTTGGHEVLFEGRKIFPIPFIMRHYPIRSEQHGKRKVLNERIPRFTEQERNKLWHIQYDDIAKEQKFLWDKNKLIKWNPYEVRLQILSEYSLVSLTIINYNHTILDNINIKELAYNFLPKFNKLQEEIIKNIISKIESVVETLVNSNINQLSINFINNFDSRILLIVEQYLTLKYCHFSLTGNFLYAKKLKDLIILLQKKIHLNSPFKNFLGFPEFLTKIDIQEKLQEKETKYKYPKEEIENLLNGQSLEQAEKLLVDYLKQFPAHIEALNDYAVLNVLKGNIDKAVQIWNKILEIDPNNELAKENLKALNLL